MPHGTMMNGAPKKAGSRTVPKFTGADLAAFTELCEPPAPLR